MLSDSLAISFLVNLLAGFIIFFVGLRWKLIASYLSRERAAFRRLFGANTVQAGIITVTLDVYRDVRLLPRQAQEKGGIRAQSFTDQSQRYFKLFPDGHATVFPGAWGDVLGYCSARAAAYLVDALGIGAITVRVVSDWEVASQWSGAFINIGSSASNIKANDIKQLPENTWLRDDLGKFVLHDGREFAMEERSDKGVILKLANPYFRGYSVVVCAGLGEWGTSGAAWFLASNWRWLSSRFGKNPFLVVVSVTPGSDTSAREICSIGRESRLWRMRSRSERRRRRSAVHVRQSTDPPGEWSI